MAEDDGKPAQSTQRAQNTVLSRPVGSGYRKSGQSRCSRQILGHLLAIRVVDWWTALRATGLCCVNGQHGSQDPLLPSGLRKSSGG